MRPRGWMAATLIAAAMAPVGCGGAHQHRAAVAVSPAPRLTGARACPGIPGFRCSRLTVPLDHAGQARGSLHLAVAVQDADRAPRGDLLFLTGGPGQPGVALIPRIRSRVAAEFSGYRLVMFDQRGTGAGALRCPVLQAAAGASDLVVPPPGSVVACARAIGVGRRYFTTPETVADIEALRRALGAGRLTIDGVSYGTYVAERYALRYPHRVARLVLDSVVPQAGVDPMYLAALTATGRVLRDVCHQQRCTWDPAADIRAVVRRYHDGPAVLNALVDDSVVYPSFAGDLAALHAAAAGRPAALERFLAAVARGVRVPAEVLSQGLHESTLCLDLAAAWDPAAPSSARAHRLADQVAALPASAVLPFDRATAYGNGLAQGCLAWPPTAPPALTDGDPAARLPAVPILLLSGERDLSTPLAWAQLEARYAPQGRLVVVPGAGHSVQTRVPRLRAVVARFLAG